MLVLHLKHLNLFLCTLKLYNALIIQVCGVVSPVLMLLSELTKKENLPTFGSYAQERVRVIKLLKQINILRIIFYA